jgi:hypothetical protein
MPTNGNVTRTAWAALAAVAFLGQPASIWARAVVIPTYTGTTNANLVFGVAPYGAPTPGTPTYIADVNTGRNDILTSPGGTFQTALPDIPHNVVGYGPAAFGPGVYQYAVQNGGTNQFGQPFGSGILYNAGTNVGFSLSDFAPAGGTASYGIENWTAHYTVGAQINAGTTYGNLIAIRGLLPAVASSAVVAMRTYIHTNAAGTDFSGAGVDLPQLVLAYGGTGTFVALGGPTGLPTAQGGGVIYFNGQSYRGLALNNIPLAANLPAGTVLDVTSAVTIYADPAAMDFFAPDITGGDADLFAGTGASSLPFFDSISSSAVPEPGSFALLGVAGCGLAAWRRKRKVS